MKSTDNFKKAIENFLSLHAEKEVTFKEKLQNPKKNIDECIAYIFSQVEKSKCNGFTDDEVYGMALHYYDEENIDVKSLNKNTRVVVNYVPELSDDEKKEAKQKAIQELIEAEKEKLTQKKKKSTEQTQTNSNTLFD